MPVGVVVTLFVAFPTITTTAIVLASGGGTLTHVLVSSEQTFVTGAVLAIRVEHVGFVDGGSRIFRVGNAVVVGAFTHPRTTHILNHKVAIDVQMALTATVLGGPFDLDEGTNKILHGRAEVVATISIILGVKETILLGVSSHIKLVVGASGVVQVRVGEDARHDCDKQDSEYQLRHGD